MNLRLFLDFLHHRNLHQILHQYPQQQFETRSLLPLLTQEHDQPLALVFSPLYSPARNFGYVVFDMAHASGYGLYALLTLISSALSSMLLNATIRAYADALEDMVVLAMPDAE